MFLSLNFSVEDFFSNKDKKFFLNVKNKINVSNNNTTKIVNVISKFIKKGKLLLVLEIKNF